MNPAEQLVGPMWYFLGSVVNEVADDLASVGVVLATSSQSGEGSMGVLCRAKLSSRSSHGQ